MSAQWWGAGTPRPGIDPQARLEFLRNQAQLLEQQLEAIKAQISSLEEKEQ
jgi:prefoldin subunit 5